MSTRSGGGTLTDHDDALSKAGRAGLDFFGNETGAGSCPAPDRLCELTARAILESLGITLDGYEWRVHSKANGGYSDICNEDDARQIARQWRAYKPAVQRRMMVTVAWEDVGKPT